MIHSTTKSWKKEFRKSGRDKEHPDCVLRLRNSELEERKRQREEERGRHRD